MQDSEIIEVYFARDERAVRESADKYGRLCHGIALRMLSPQAKGESLPGSLLFR